MSTRIRVARAAGWVGGLVGWAIVGSASGQMAPVPSAEALPSTGPSAAMVLSNPYTNPYLNPYLNPTAPQRAISARDTAMYLYMANQANGGIGTGRISQTRPGAAGVMAQARPGLAGGMIQARPGAAGGIAGAFAPSVARQGMMNRPITSRQPRPAEMPDSASLPGAGAARFFNPYPIDSNGAGRYYNRRNTYFNSNGR